MQEEILKLPVRPLACVILAAGKGTRMKSDIPKVLHPVAHRPMLHHVIGVAEKLAPDKIVVVIGPDMDDVAMASLGHKTVVQTKQAGTADAVNAARSELEGFDGDVLVLYGDTPLLTPLTLRKMLAARLDEQDPAVVVFGMRPDNPAQYGRLVMKNDGALDAIVEYIDADEKQRAIDLVNGGLMAFDGKVLFELLDSITPDNQKGEYYLTDAVKSAHALGRKCQVVEGDHHEVAGVNSRADLAAVEAQMQRRLRAEAMENGVTLVAPDTVMFSADTQLSNDVLVGPYVVFGPGVEVASRVEIRPFSHLEGVKIEPRAIVGPFVRLRPGTEIGAGAGIGNFVELKKSKIGAGTKVNHLSYVGDATIGENSNIGAGTITCNYDGMAKYETHIGNYAFIGSNSSLVAPVSVGDGAMVAAGSVITRDVEAEALAVARGRQSEKPGWVKKFRHTKEEEK